MTDEKQATGLEAEPATSPTKARARSLTKAPAEKRKKKQPVLLPVVGWREWIQLPELAHSALVKAKIDTGATTSAIHAENLELDHGADGRAFASFQLLPSTNGGETVTVEGHPVVAFRFVKSSSGHGSYRPVIRTELSLGTQSFDIDLTLTGRDQMGFRMLIGRAALRGRFHVDPSGSFLLTKKLGKP